MMLDPGAFRAVLGRFASGVTVVSTVHGGLDHAMTASAFSSVSMDPPLVAVFVDRQARFHDAVVASRRWAVSILAESGQDAATWFAHQGRPELGQFDQVDHVRGDATGAPLVRQAIGWLECLTWAEYDGGDHLILVGEVVAARVLPDGAVTDAEGSDRPLLYHRSHYAALLRSLADERSQVALRAAIIEDGANEAEHRGSGADERG